MAYRSDIPVDTNNVRGATGDLALTRENFVILAPVGVSGINGLISGGANVSGAVPVAQSSSADAPWFARKLSIGNATLSGDILSINISGITSGQTVKWNGVALVPSADDNSGVGGGGGAGEAAKVGLITMASGQMQVVTASAQVLLTGLNTVRLNSGGFTMSSGTITVPTGSGYAFVVLRAAYALESGLNGLGRHTIVIRKNAVSGAITDTAGSPYVTIDIDSRSVANSTDHFQLGATSPRIPVSGGEVFGLYAYHEQLSGQANAIGGASPYDGTLSWFSIEAFSATSGAVAAEGEYLGHLTMASGQSQAIPNNTATLVTGLTTTRRNVGGFTMSSGSITVPTGSGYTHVQLTAHLTWNSTISEATNVGYRQMQLRLNGDSSGLLRDLNNAPYMHILNRQAPIATSGLSSNVQYTTPLLPVSGGEVFTLFATHTQGSTIDLTGGTSQEGTNCFFGIRAFKLTSGGTG